MNDREHSMSTSSTPQPELKKSLNTIQLWSIVTLQQKSIESLFSPQPIDFITTAS